MAVQVGRTVISFTIKYVQSEKEKLKSDISKVLDSKNKMKAVLPIKAAAIPSGPADINHEIIQVPNLTGLVQGGNPGTYPNYPLEMQ
jgi:hypothetical protein